MMQSKIIKWENGRAIEVTNVKDARIEPNIGEIGDKYKQERCRTGLIKENTNNNYASIEI